MIGLFDPRSEDDWRDPSTPDDCPYCGSAIKVATLDTGTPLMRVVPCQNGPYVLEGDLLRFVDNAGHVLSQGKAERVLRHARSSDTRWASHFYNCPEAGRWSTVKPKKEE